MNTNWMIPFGFLLLAAGLASTCGSGRDASARETAPSPSSSSLEGFWWIRVGEQSAAVANFGPLLNTAKGSARRWSLTIHLPGSTEPLSCLQGIADSDSYHAITARGDGFLVELTPVAGRTWGEVSEEHQLVALVNGLY